MSVMSPKLVVEILAILIGLMSAGLAIFGAVDLFLSSQNFLESSSSMLPFTDGEFRQHFWLSDDKSKWIHQFFLFCELDNPIDGDREEEVIRAYMEESLYDHRIHMHKPWLESQPELEDFSTLYDRYSEAYGGVPLPCLPSVDLVSTSGTQWIATSIFKPPDLPGIIYLLGASLVFSALSVAIVFLEGVLATFADRCGGMWNVKLEKHRNRLLKCDLCIWIISALHVLVVMVLLVVSGDQVFAGQATHEGFLRKVDLDVVVANVEVLELPYGAELPTQVQETAIQFAQLESRRPGSSEELKGEMWRKLVFGFDEAELTTHARKKKVREAVFGTPESVSESKYRFRFSPLVYSLANGYGSLSTGSSRSSNFKRKLEVAVFDPVEGGMMCTECADSSRLAQLYRYMKLVDVEDAEGVSDVVEKNVDSNHMKREGANFRSFPLFSVQNRCWPSDLDYIEFETPFSIRRVENLEFWKGGFPWWSSSKVLGKDTVLYDRENYLLFTATSAFNPNVEKWVQENNINVEELTRQIPYFLNKLGSLDILHYDREGRAHRDEDVNVPEPSVRCGIPIFMRTSRCSPRFWTRYETRDSESVEMDLTARIAPSIGGVELYVDPWWRKEITSTGNPFLDYYNSALDAENPFLQGQSNDTLLELANEFEIETFTSRPSLDYDQIRHLVLESGVESVRVGTRIHGPLLPEFLFEVRSYGQVTAIDGEKFESLRLQIDYENATSLENSTWIDDFVGFNWKKLMNALEGGNADGKLASYKNEFLREVVYPVFRSKVHSNRFVCGSTGMISGDTSAGFPLVIPSTIPFKIDDEEASSLRGDVQQGLLVDVFVTLLDPLLILLTHRTLPALRWSAAGKDRDSERGSSALRDALSEISFLWDPCQTWKHGAIAGSRIGLMFGSIFGIVILAMAATNTIVHFRYADPGTEVAVFMISLAALVLMGTLCGICNGILYQKIVEREGERTRGASGSASRRFQRKWTCTGRIVSWSGLISLFVAAILVWATMSIHDAALPPKSVAEVLNAVQIRNKSEDSAEGFFEQTNTLAFFDDSYRQLDNGSFQLSEPSWEVRDDMISWTTFCLAPMRADYQSYNIIMGKGSLCMSDTTFVVTQDNFFLEANQMEWQFVWSQHTEQRPEFWFEWEFLDTWFNTDTIAFWQRTRGIEEPPAEVQSGIGISHLFVFDLTPEAYFSPLATESQSTTAWGQFRLYDQKPKTAHFAKLAFQSGSYTFESPREISKPEDMPTCKVTPLQIGDSMVYDIDCKDNTTCTTNDGFDPDYPDELDNCACVVIVVELNERVETVRFAASEHVAVKVAHCGDGSVVDVNPLQCYRDEEEPAITSTKLTGVDDGVELYILITVALVSMCLIVTAAAACSVVCCDFRTNPRFLFFGINCCAWCCLDTSDDGLDSRETASMNRLEKRSRRSLHHSGESRGGSRIGNRRSMRNSRAPGPSTHTQRRSSYKGNQGALLSSKAKIQAVPTIQSSAKYSHIPQRPQYASVPQRPQYAHIPRH